ncbi:mucin-6-like isoform X1 [Choristoneura fumiferana]|uniref:mucin-6-like isoform X1 n=1 Tax=Choristoneura fumiferana TaxID=7141 RepID=UPI003D157693
MYVFLIVSAVTVFFDSAGALSIHSSEPVKCGPNEMFTPCYNDCQLTCKNRIKGYRDNCTVCTQGGCICQPQYYRHDNGSCVLEENCSPPYCNNDEEYNSCGASCLDTCDQRGNTCQDCSLRCVKGCFCPKGFFREPNGACVKAEDCPPRTCNGPNEYFDECPPTCLDALDESCSTIWSGVNCTETLDCCEPQCRCKTGYYRDTEGFCISAESCLYDGIDTGTPWWEASSTSKPQVINENSIPTTSKING